MAALYTLPRTYLPENTFFSGTQQANINNRRNIMQVTTRITTEEYENFLKWAQKRGKRWKINKFCWVVVAAITVLILFAEVKSFNLEGLIAPCVLIFMTITPYFMPKYKARHFLKRNPQITQVQTLIIDESGIESSSESRQGKLNWSAFMGYSELSDIFILMTSTTTALLIPKKDLSFEQIKMIRKLISQAMITKY